MKYSTQLRLFLLIIFCGVLPAQALLRGRSFFSPRSQSTHAERELVGWQEYINIYSNDCCNYGCITLTPMYSQSFRPCHIAEYFFGTNTLRFTGSSVADRQDDDLLADYFGLPMDFVSQVTFCPKIRNELIDFDWYEGLDGWYPGLYVRLHTPLVHTVWNAHMCESVQESGSQAYPAGYMANEQITRGQMVKDVTEYFRGHKAVGDIQPLRYGKIDCRKDHTALSDIQVAFGWNPVNAPDHHFGFNFRTAIPTGNRSQSKFFFEPIVGNGGHWEFGVGLTGHTVLFQTVDEGHIFSIYGDINLMHLFATCQKRSFDFRDNGTLSRYMLLQEIGTPIVQGLQVGDVDATQQYHGALMPAINRTSLNVWLSVALQVDLVIKLAYIHNNFNVDVGYNLWARTSERFECREHFAGHYLAVKGDAQMYGFHVPTQRFVALNATQSQATIHAGQGTGNADLTNANADNSFDPATSDPLFATFDIGGDTELVTQPGGATMIRGSQQSILLSNNDIDNLSAAATPALSHTFFAHFNYSWKHCTRIPFIGCGAEVTADGGSRKRHSALSEWAIWIKTGIAY